MKNKKLIDAIESLGVYKTRLMAFVKNHRPDLYEAVLKNTSFLDEQRNSTDISFAERLYCIKNDITSCVVCPVCGKPVRFNTDVSSYRKTCSTSCSRKTESTISKFRESLSKKDDPTNVEKSRRTRYSKNNGKWHADDFTDKVKATMLAEHGVTNWNNPDKRISTSMSRYGVPHPMSCESVKQKQIKSIHEKYGVDCVFKLDSVRSKTYASIRKNAWLKLMESKDVIPLTPEDEFFKIENINTEDCIKFKCKKCGKPFMGYWDNGHTRPCPHCCSFGHGSSEQEKEIIEFLKKSAPSGYSVFSKHKINRQVIPPKELDIVITDANGKIKLAVEYDGLYWHCESVKNDKKYHVNKTDLCEEKNIQLVHVFENEWLSKPDIVKSRLNNLLGNYDKTVYARMCKIQDVSDAESRSFLDANHIQGHVNASVSIGLYFENEIIALMTFGKCRFSGKYEWEMLRFCTKAGYHVPGAAGKLLKHFEKSKSPSSLVSYADRRWSMGSLYKSLGFTLDHTSAPNYWYFKPHDTRYVYSRIRFQKHTLKSKLKKFDESLSEIENMRANGYDRIFDCGNLVFVKTY